MKYRSKERLEADALRHRIKSLLEAPFSWRGYEDRRDWLRKLLRKDEDYIYSERERAAVGRIVVARTPFEGWGGYSVQELYRGARPYLANFDESYEPLMNEIEATDATRLVRDDMKALVALCVMSGMDLPKFPSRPQAYDYDDA
jgi:hypothetical protein